MRLPTIKSNHPRAVSVLIGTTIGRVTRCEAQEGWIDSPLVPAWQHTLCITVRGKLSLPRLTLYSGGMIFDCDEPSRKAFQCYYFSQTSRDFDTIPNSTTKFRQVALITHESMNVAAKVYQSLMPKILSPTGGIITTYIQCKKALMNEPTNQSSSAHGYRRWDMLQILPAN